MSYPVAVMERFMRKVDIIPGGCWEWRAYRAKISGYGFFNVTKRKQVGAHRVSYELHIGPIPEGLEPDHLCRNRGCVCPWHLEAVTHRENCIRGMSPNAINARKTHCKRGHLYNAASTGTRKTRPGTRWCKICRNDLRRGKPRKRK